MHEETGRIMSKGQPVGMAPARLVESSTVLLHPEDQVFDAMLAGWADQQKARNLSRDTIRERLSLVRRFYRHTNEYPWVWTAQHLDEFSADLIFEAVAKSTLRLYQAGLRWFLDYVTDPRYSWVSVCERLFGTFPVQICFPWNTADHVAEYEGRPQRRSLTRVELQRLFDYADERVAEARNVGKKGWTAVIRDATALKVAYAWGLRRGS
jgi:integrase